MADLVSSSEAAPLLGVATGEAARDKLRRHGAQPVSRRPGRGGENLYRRSDIEQVVRDAPGKGSRTDLHRNRK